MLSYLLKLFGLFKLSFQIRDAVRPEMKFSYI